MNGYEQPAFEQPAAEPAQPAGPSRRGLVIAILAGVVLVAVVIAGILIWRASRRPSPEAASLEQRIATQERLCESAQNPDACRNDAILEIAEQTGQGDVCVRLDGEARDLCVYRDAQRNQNVERCKALSTDELQSGCANVIHLNAAQASGDASACDRISDSEMASACRRSIEAVLTAEVCRAQGRDATLCEDIARKEAAIAAGDLALCDSISTEEGRVACEDFVGIKDADADGLSAYDERSYSTNPRNPDTDGDSFPDGAEVSDGYNPNGPGRL